MMKRLTQQDKYGNYCLDGVTYEQLYEGHRIEFDAAEKIYGALRKLKDYEDTGMDPEDVERMKEACGWIPVDERLPKPGKRYLTTMKYRESDVVGVYEAVYGSDGLWYRENSEPIHECLTVIAWRSLPDPYRED